MRSNHVTITSFSFLLVVVAAVVFVIFGGGCLVVEAFSTTTTRRVAPRRPHHNHQQKLFESAQKKNELTSCLAAARGRPHHDHQQKLLECADKNELTSCLGSTTKDFADQEKISLSDDGFTTNRRQAIGLIAGTFFLVTPSVANAGEIGAKITKAVTTSDLGISVRTSVVRGAQVIDTIDGKWERFSDKFGLGSERSKAGERPKPKIIPEPLPLDTNQAQAILKTTDEVYLALMQSAATGITPGTLERQITKVSELVRPSFFKKGDTATAITPAQQFNFDSYVHFKAYSDLILQQGKSFDFKTFRQNFESQTGQKLVTLLLPQSQSQQQPTKGSNNKSQQQEVLNQKLNQIEQLCQNLKDIGLVSLTERSTISEDQLEDWLEDSSELSFTIALDGDITLGSQMLLQEQGFVLYPDYTKFAISSLLSTGLEKQDVQIEDYYFDTDYNSDPDKFEVKEVVLNIVIDSSI